MAEKHFGLKKILKRHFDPSLEMLERMIEHCPDELWTKVNGGFPFWQQIFHAYESIDYWMRGIEVDYEELKFNKDVASDLDKTCNDSLSKDELKSYAEKVRQKVEKYFEELDSQNLLKQSRNSDKFSYCDIVLCQIRHIQYHAGHCNSILRQYNYKAVDWIGYGEE